MALIVFAYFSMNFSGCMNQRSMFFSFIRSLMNSKTINYYFKAAASQISVNLYSELNLVVFSTIVELF